MIGLWFVLIVVGQATGNNSIVFTSELKKYYMANKVTKNLAGKFCTVGREFLDLGLPRECQICFVE